MVFLMWLVIVVMLTICTLSFWIVMTKDLTWLEGIGWCAMFFVAGFGVIMAIRELIGEGILL